MCNQFIRVTYHQLLLMCNEYSMENVTIFNPNYELGTCKDD